MNRNNNSQRGFTLLLSIVVAGILLAVGLSLLSIALKQFKISNIGQNSEEAFHAANAGVECMKYWDQSSENGGKFDVGASNDTITCFGNSANVGGVASGEEQNFEFAWDNTGTSEINDNLCTNVSIWKFFDSGSSEDMSPAGITATCPAGIECTVIRSRGYNRDCSELNSLKTVERALFVRY